MKKTISILAALFAAIVANAQITLEHTFDHQINFGSGIATCSGGFFNSETVIGNYLYEEDQEQGIVLIYDARDCTLLKTLNKPENTAYVLVSRGIFTTDNKWSFVSVKQTSTEGWDFDYKDCKYYYLIQIQTEDGIVLATLNTQAFCEDYVIVAKVGEEYKLVVKKGDVYDYYSLPGNGETQDISTPSSPRHARKFTHDGKVLVQTEESTYTMQGQEVK